ncbi:hypothetical protein PINS_up002185 [Pythium insidiosum]|nr:hypothetical protein PINS_up002185 [Pythium insidiosum]
MAPPRKLRVLCLHGFRTNGKVLQAQMTALERAFGANAEFIYLNAPHPARGPPEPIVRQRHPHDGPFFEWLSVSATSEQDGSDWIWTIKKLEASMAFLDAQLATIGAVDVAVGFSQGAFLITTYVARNLMLHGPNGHPWWTLNVCVSGMFIRGINVRRYFERVDGSLRRLRFPSIHVVGRRDSYNESETRLAQVYDADRTAFSSASDLTTVVMEHDGGHRFPSTKTNATLKKQSIAAAMTPTRRDVLRLRGEEHVPLTSAAPDDREDALESAESRVYRPLLFASKGYASSELFRDAYEMRSRLAQQGSEDESLHGANSSGTGPLRHVADPRIRLETLSSRATYTVLWITYLSFVLALVLPYLQSQGYLETVITLPGAVCDDRPLPVAPCIAVDTAKNIAKWSAIVNNVSWYAGAIQLRVSIQDLVFESNLTAALHPADMRTSVDEKSRTKMRGGFNDSWDLADVELDVADEAFALHYDVLLYGVDIERHHRLATRLIASETNQSVWVTCPSRVACSSTRLLEVTDELGGDGFESYLVTLVFKGLYPNLKARQITYEFAYTKPAIHVGELIVRTGLLLTTILSLPCWFIAVLNGVGSWHDVLPVQRWVLALGIVLMLWQNPVYTAVEWVRNVNVRTRFVAEACEAFAQAFFYVFWLKLMDHRRGWRSVVPKLVFGIALLSVDIGMSMLRLPSLFPSSQSGSVPQQNEIYVLMGFIRIAMLFGWLAWIARLSWQTRGYLVKLPYMSTRFEQLSYRFLFLQALLIFLYVLIFSSLELWHLLRTWYLMGCDALIQAALHEFAKVHATQRMLELAWQAYFDPPGSPSPSGYGQLSLEDYGYELVAQLRGPTTDTYALVAVSASHNRLVIAFRGTTSKLNWKSNLKFHQEVLWIKSKGKVRGRTCMEKVKDGLAKIPILNMALPRVHSGFWNAYASVRGELREVIRLVLDENPGVAVYITGHSMGGALAVLAAYDLAVNMSMKVSMFSFGGPRVGNPSFVRLYDKCIPASYRVVMDGDIVPGVPDFWGLYQHVGTEIAIDLEGNLIVDPTFVEKKLHVSSKHRVATHPTHVYRSSMAKCLENLRSSC